MLARTGLALVGVAVLACNNANNASDAGLVVETLALYGARNPASFRLKNDSWQAPATASTIAVRWQAKIRLPDAAVTASTEFATVRPSAEAPVDIRIDSSNGTIFLLDWPLPRVAVPIARSNAGAAAGAATAPLATLRGQISAWTTSLLGQRSELHVRNRSAFAAQAPTSVEALNDRYATASIDIGSGSVNCTCTGGTGSNCAGGQIVCLDPGGFAAGASAFTVVIPADSNELALIERVTETSSGAFVETGNLHYDNNFSLGDGEIREQIFDLNIAPRFQLCGVEGFAAIHLENLDRRFVIASHGQLVLDLALRSPNGLSLPIFVGDVWPALAVAVDSAGQLVRWRYPFALTDALAGFVYEFAAEATGLRVDTVGTAYVDRSKFYGETNENGICQLRAKMPLYTEEFLEPNGLAPYPAKPEQISWLGGSAAAVRRLLIESETSPNRTEFWLFSDSRNSIQLNGDSFDELTLAPGAYRLRLQVFPGATPEAALLPALADVEALGPVFEQSHAFVVP